MNAWIEQQPDLRWFHVKVADVAYPFMRDDLRARHNGAKNGTVMSVLVNQAKTEAVVKVAGCGNWRPLLSTPIIRVYSPTDLPELQLLVASTEWRPPSRQAVVLK